MLSDKKLREQVLALEASERAELIEDLLLSFSPDKRKEIDAAWAVEVEKRIKAVDSGKMKTYSFDESLERARQL